LSRVLCGCVGDENGVWSTELSVDGGELDLVRDWDAERSTNCPRLFLKGFKASVNAESETGDLRLSD